MSCISINQPAYLPWLGYFERIKNSDIFIFLDSVQFEKNSFINRNKIKTPQGSTWITVPIIKSRSFPEIKEVIIDTNKKWKKKHLNSIYFNYKKAKHFEKCFAKLENLYSKDHKYLADLCYDHLLFWLDELDITTTIVRSKDLYIQSRKSDLILDICKHFNVKKYISGEKGKDYLIDYDFKLEGISIEYQNFEYPKYEQLWGEFLPNMSILDFWMNTDQYNLIWQNKQR
ncbi:WbqC family protein [Halalkalibacter lacteus]|uniref:WbqC family protein n=1 Tax=Halalkalibacter lacteus TaxID=3090663 RepID=UPI002FC998C4